MTTSSIESSFIEPSYACHRSRASSFIESRCRDSVTADATALGKDCAGCSIAGALGIIGERWTLLIVRDALYGIRRYNDFLVHLGIPRAVLATRLQMLTEEGILEKRRYAVSPRPVLRPGRAGLPPPSSAA
jgi:DNA-binding HxlR family transcriptional regulator